MSRLVGKELTAALFERLRGQNVETYEGKIIPIFAIDESGWPHPALLSYYEVVAKDLATLDIALWKNSSTARHLRQNGKITVLITDQGINYYLKGSVEELQTEIPGMPLQSRFRITTEQLLEDQEPNAEITSGLTYRRERKRDSGDHAVEVFKRLRGGP
jgi:hypothetical protein